MSRRPETPPNVLLARKLARIGASARHAPTAPAPVPERGCRPVTRRIALRLARSQGRDGGKP